MSAAIVWFFLVSGKMWLSMTPIKLDSWWIVWLLTFRSSSHPLNLSSLRYEVLHWWGKILSNVLYCFRLLISMFCFVFGISAGPAEYHADSWMFCLSLSHLPPTDRLDSSCPAMSRGSRGTLWLFPPQTVTSGSRTGDVVLSFYLEIFGSHEGLQNQNSCNSKCRRYKQEKIFFTKVVNVHCSHVYLQILKSFFTASSWHLLLSIMWLCGLTHKQKDMSMLMLVLWDILL